MVRQRDIIGPDVKLPLSQTQDPAVDSATMDPHSHVHVDTGDFPHQS